MKKNAISLLAADGKVEICISTDRLICKSVLLPKQARRMANELMKIADIAERIPDDLLIKRENVIRTEFKKRRVA